MAAKKITGEKAAGFKELKKRATKKTGTAPEQSAAELEKHAADVMRSLTFETALVEPNPWHYGHTIKREGKEMSYHWNRAGIGVYGTYMHHIAENEIAKAAPLMLFHRLVNPETGERLFTEAEHLEQLRAEGVSEIVLEVATEMLKTDNDSETFFNSKVDQIAGN